MEEDDLEIERLGAVILGWAVNCASKTCNLVQPDFDDRKWWFVGYATAELVRYLGGEKYESARHAVISACRYGIRHYWQWIKRQTRNPVVVEPEAVEHAETADEEHFDPVEDAPEEIREFMRLVSEGTKWKDLRKKLALSERQCNRLKDEARKYLEGRYEPAEKRRKQS